MAPEGTKEHFRIPGYPVTPAIFLALVGIAWVEGLRQSPRATGAALATIAVGVLIYYVGIARGWIPRAAKPPST